MIDALEDDGFGRWQITTYTGTGYFLDLDRRIIRRMPGRSEGSSPMRRDGHDVDPLNLVHCTLGVPPVLLLDLQLPGTFSTQRPTAGVTRIRVARSNGTS